MSLRRRLESLPARARGRGQQPAIYIDSYTHTLLLAVQMAVQMAERPLHETGMQASIGSSIH